MRALLKSDFALRFAGGFVLGAIALVGMQLDNVTANPGLVKTEAARIG